MKWEDITTAPKDGRAVLVTDGREVHLTYWLDDWFCYHHSTDKGTALSDVMSKPTYWMELPELPCGKQADNAKPIYRSEEELKIYEVGA